MGPTDPILQLGQVDSGGWTNSQPAIVASTWEEARRLLAERPFAALVVLPNAFAQLPPQANGSFDKWEAIHRAGRDLAALDAELLEALDPNGRIELLKANILRYARQLLHQDKVDIRLLHPITGALEPLVSEGMLPGVRELRLYAQEAGNGISGHVAATGRSYYCPDTSRDPLYIEGAPGAQSCLSVPLLEHGQVIGVLTVENEKPNAYTPQDREFIEIFSAEVASALHTLKLLGAERRSTATKSLELMGRELAQPVDDILNTATALLERYSEGDQELTEGLRKILMSARSAKRSVLAVGDALAPALDPTAPPQRAYPQLRDLRVLVADADERVRRSAHAILGRFGCIVETAHNGRETLAMTWASTYDIILADIRLPDMTGYELFQKLRQRHPTLPIVLMSDFGYDASHSIVKARQEGLHGVLYKPFRIDQLLEVLSRSRGGATSAGSLEAARLVASPST